MRPLGALLLGTAAYGAFLLATAPATLLVAPATSASRGQVRLAHAQGTIWNGRARVEITSAGNALVVDEVRWRFLPARLLAGRLAIAAEARTPGLTARFEGARSVLEWSVRDLEAVADAAKLTPAFPLLSVWQPAGAVSAQAAFLAWNGHEATGEASAEWRDAALSMSPVRPLGTWRIQARAEDTSIKFALATARGPLRLSGTGAVRLDGRLGFSGEARAEPGHERELEGLLALIGPPRADGARALALR